MPLTRRAAATGPCGTPRRRTAHARLRPQAEAVEIEIDHRRRVERQHLADHQPADDRDAERPAQLGAFAEADRQRQRAEHRRHRRHHDRAEAQQAAW